MNVSARVVLDDSFRGYFRSVPPAFAFTSTEIQYGSYVVKMED